MSSWRRLRSLWRNLVHRRRVDRELDDELQGALEMLVGEHRQAGLSPAEARRAATMQLGRTASLKEQVRDVKAGAFIDGWIQDVRYALRLLRRGPLFAVFAIGSLALGIGATGAIFSLFDGIALRRLNVPEPDRLVVASWGKPGTRFNYSLPYPQMVAISERSTTLDAICWLSPYGRVGVSVAGEPQAADAVLVSGDYYRTLRLAPALGRLLDRTDDRLGQTVAVLTHAYWQRRFGGRIDVIGATIAINQVPFTVIGVEPSGFSGTEVGRPYDVSIPVQASPALNEGKPPLRGPFTTWLYVLGRMKPGVTLAAADQETRTIFAQVTLDAAKSPGDQKLAREYQFQLEPGARGGISSLRDGYERWLGLLLMLLGAVLLLASLNVATLLLSRSDARQREIATRLAVGAGRWRIVRQFLTESLVLAACAGAVGVAIAVWGSRTLLRIAIPAAERVPLNIGPDWRLILFMLGVTAVTCLLFGLVPALRATSPRRFVGVRQIGGGRQRRLLDRTLVAAQVGISLILLVAAGLFLRTLGNLWAQDPGYNRQNVLMFSVDPRLAGRTGEDIPRTFLRILDELKAFPGAQAVTMSAVRPVSDNYYFINSFREINGKVLTDEQRIRVAFNHVAPGYFATLGIPLVAGRDFDERDSIGAPGVIIISERLARRFEGNPIGQVLGAGAAAREVVGVARDTRYANVKDAPRDVVYYPFLQIAPASIFYTPTFEIRYAGTAAGLTQGIRTAVARVDRGLTVFRLTTLERQTEDSFARERLLALLTSYFGAFAVLLACIGLYGLMSYGVTQRTAEMGLRLALGAPPSAVRWLVVRESAWTVIAGAALGLGGVFGVVRVVRSQLFGVQPNDPAALAGAIALLLTMAFVAAYLPARRASRIDPLTALRHE